MNAHNMCMLPSFLASPHLLSLSSHVEAHLARVVQPCYAGVMRHQLPPQLHLPSPAVSPETRGPAPFFPSVRYCDNAF